MSSTANTEREKLIAYIEVTFAVIVWGASFVATKIALQDVSPVTVVWLRFGMGVLILGGAVVARREFAFPPVKELGYFALLGFLGIAFHQWLQSTGLQTAQATTTAWIVSAIPVIQAVLAALVLKEKLKRWAVIGIALAALGVMLIVSKGDPLSLIRSGATTPGDILIIVSAFNWPIFSILSRRGLRKFPATLMLFYVMLIGWLFTSVLLFSGPGLSEIRQLTFNGWSGVAFLGIFCTGLAYIFWYDALRLIPVSQVGVFIYVEPLVAVVIAALVLAESLTLPTLLGGSTILLGVWLVNKT
jgi:drug/metabolite transporter (DMT)-like permease